MSHNRRICLVDDDAAVLDSTRLLLESHGFEVFGYPSSEAFLQLAKQCSVLVADLGMSGISGLDLVEILREASEKTPAILLADVVDPSTAQRLAAVTHCICLMKPTTPAALIEAIQTICDQIPA